LRSVRGGATECATFGSLWNHCHYGLLLRRWNGEINSAVLEIVSFYDNISYQLKQFIFIFQTLLCLIISISALACRQRLYKQLVCEAAAAFIPQLRCCRRRLCGVFVVLSVSYLYPYCLAQQSMARVCTGTTTAGIVDIIPSARCHRYRKHYYIFNTLCRRKISIRHPAKRRKEVKIDINIIIFILKIDSSTWRRFSCCALDSAILLSLLLFMPGGSNTRTYRT
jgi:hypothetical protein